MRKVIAYVSCGFLAILFLIGGEKEMSAPFIAAMFVIMALDTLVQ